MKDSLHIPPFVNYTCQQCGWCCRQYEINFSQADHDRLAKVDWGKLEPTLAGKEWCSPIPAGKHSGTHRMRFTDEPACVFLSPDNLCLMHKHVGESGKALGCCVYPFTFAATPDGIYVGCRFSCKAVAYGIGEPIVHKKVALRKQLALCENSKSVAHYSDKVDFDGHRTLPWADYMRLEKSFISLFLRDDLPFARRLFMAGKLIEILTAAQVERVRGPRFEEFMDILDTGLANEAQTEALPDPVGGISNVLFRQFCFLFQRRQGGAWREMSTPARLKARVSQFGRGLQFAFGVGSPQFLALDGHVSLDKLERFAAEPLGSEEEFALSRFLATKLYGKQHFGKLFFNYSVLQGLHFLILTAGAVMWYARAHALARNAAKTEPEDVIEAIRYVDYCYAYSRAPALFVERTRIRILARDNTSLRLALAQFPPPEIERGPADEEKD